ncbi:hypothetical protein QQM79_15270 [Marinobacteraceae bacterium S3BR75-40.1]
MAYRLLVMVLALVLVGLVFACFWLGSAAFLKQHGETREIAERARVMAMWTFMGFGVGLIFVGLGGPILGSYAFCRVARQEVDVPLATSLLWGIGIVLPTSILAAALVAFAVLTQ